MMPSMFAAPLMLALVKVTVLLGAALLLLPFLRRSAASVRHAVCLLALGGSMFLVPLSLVPTPVAVPFSIEIHSAATAATSVPGSSVAWTQILWILWGAGALVVTVRYAAGLLAVRALMARSTPVDHHAWRADLDGLHPGGAIDLRFAPLDTAVTCGLFRPAILLPLEAAGWQRSHRLAVLMHEVAHIHRRDLWAGVVAALATALFWFHPFAWILAARMRQEQECACDDSVLNRGVTPSRYAELLLQSTGNAPAEPFFACAMTGRYAFRSRLLHVLDPARTRIPRRAALRGIGASAAALVAVLAVLQPVWAEDVYKIGGDVKAPKLIQKVEPKYTEAAKNAKIEGTVVVETIVGTNGRIREPRIIRSLDPGLDNNALDALAQWVFEPGTRKGEPVSVKARIEINFRLN